MAVIGHEHGTQRTGVYKVLDGAKKERHISIDNDQFFALAEELADVTTSLSQGEVDFLVGEAGLPAEMFERTRIAAAAVSVRRVAEDADHRGLTGLSTSQVSVMLGRAPSNVRRSAGTNDLYTIHARHNRELVFPEWQFPNGRPLPGLRLVLDSFRVVLHPLDLETFMTSPSEELDGRSPVDWLAAGGAPELVAELAAEIGRL
ncbi:MULTISPECIES: hypothetical protein [Arthrobacter]|uniref:Antitoxin Xre/MbcA/ParS-like toxin-binding domain-containing protein n=2 Tax=Arthrobacter TaxID=1663 RepID=A0ABU9KQQ5_9MICC|nr:hypothetical protein [Arthrobacter sp. YJM1]MDP5228644.1 hypothetical protein [Arthrobacter sp. YJM1]